jgi:uncharacterized protein YbjQ (UPF0145 family)
MTSFSRCQVINDTIIPTRQSYLQTLFGGDITLYTTLYTTLCEHAREEAYERMVAHAAAMGANAVIAMRYDAALMDLRGNVDSAGTWVAIKIVAVR